MQAQWERLKQLMHDFEQAAKPFTEGFAQLVASASPQPPGKHLRELARLVRQRTQQLWDDSGARIPDSLALLLSNFVNGREPSADPAGMFAFIVEMRRVQAELADALAAPELRLAEATERAFLHLRRLIVASPDVGSHWQAAFNNDEPACEKLGALHLLQHGIYAFKANTPQDRTDLILGERLVLDEYELSALRGLVLTEWKRVTDPKQTASFTKQALTQAALYAGGSLAGTELRSTRYLVLVSRGYLPGLERAIAQDDVSYRIVNLAVEPASPHLAKL
jgi:hypothetical protein